jgi:hypothetical protein
LSGRLDEEEEEEEEEDGHAKMPGREREGKL